ncbi:MAG: ATP-binding protein [Spirochaetes bacterium]|jgi:signal transduction histidine kinase/HAMP domain-containing protein|nr:ATP-binding protein [Spirochaetota bacterium]
MIDAVKKFFLDRLRVNSLKTRIILWTCIVSFSSLAILAVVFYFRTSNALMENESRGLVAVRDLYSREIGLWLDGVSHDLKNISGSGEIRSLSEAAPGGALTDALRPLLQNRMNAYSIFYEIMLVDSGGRVIASTRERGSGEDAQAGALAAESVKSGEILVRDAFYSKEMNSAVIVAAAPVYSASDGRRIVAAVAGKIIYEKALSGIVSGRTGLGDSGEVLLINKKLNPLGRLMGYNGNPADLRIDEKYSRLALGGGTGVTEGSDYRGKKVLAAYMNIPRTGWALVAKRDTEEIMKPLRSDVVLIWLLLLVLGLAVFSEAVMMASNASGPIISLTDFSNRVREGDYSARIAAGRIDEFNDLSRALNGMADSILSQLDVQKRSLELIEVMVSSLDLNDFSRGLLSRLIEITESSIGAFYVLSKDGSDFIHLSSIGLDSDKLDAFHSERFEGEFGRALATRSVAVTRNIDGSSILNLRTIIGDVPPTEIMTIPVIVKNRSMAIISMATMSAYTDEMLRILDTVRPVMSTAFSNILANEETRRLMLELSEKNQMLESQKDALEFQADEMRRQSDQLKKQNIELDMQRVRVEEANKLKSEFLSNMSHELRTPLNSILALSRVLSMQLKDRLSDEESGYIKIINQNGGKLLTLINDILDLSKIEAGRIDLRPKRIALHSIIGIITDNLEQLAEEKGIYLKVDVPRDLPQIESDESRVYQIFQNIIGNAVKFTEEGGVEITADGGPGTVKIRVRDTGIGIAEENLPHIFEEFRQIDGTLTRKYDGTGLGLAIASKSAELISGTIRAESRLGGGSMFEVTLPVAWARQDFGNGRVSVSAGRDPDPGPVDGTGAESRTDESPAPGRRYRVLVVDDDRDNITTLNAVLQNRYEILEARDGKSAVEYALNMNPDIILLDIALPGMSGFEVAAVLKADRIARRIPIIAVTALTMVGDRERILRAGCDDYIPKPYSIDDLLSKMERWLRVAHE